jgi:cytochrome c peroxidase
MRRLIIVLAVVTSLPAFGQRGGGGGGGGGANRGNPPLASLKTVVAPAPQGIENYVTDPTALVALGKAFFWDSQAGSGGHTACATCHFHAGADHRLQNQLSGAGAAINHRLTNDDFPFHQLSNTGNRNSTVLSDRQQVAGSAGVVAKLFTQVKPGNSTDQSTTSNAASQFLVEGIHVRQATGRNSPSVINAVINVRNFWDGRARNLFTGATPFGDSDTGLNALVLRDGSLRREAVRVANASLASQAVGPALNATEMSWAALG